MTIQLVIIWAVAFLLALTVRNQAKMIRKMRKTAKDIEDRISWPGWQNRPEEYLRQDIYDMARAIQKGEDVKFRAPYGYVANRLEAPK